MGIDAFPSTQRLSSIASGYSVYDVNHPDAVVGVSANPQTGCYPSTFGAPEARSAELAAEVYIQYEAAGELADPNALAAAQSYATRLIAYGVNTVFYLPVAGQLERKALVQAIREATLISGQITPVEADTPDPSIVQQNFHALEGVHNSIETAVRAARQAEIARCLDSWAEAIKEPASPQGAKPIKDGLARIQKEFDSLQAMIQRGRRGVLPLNADMAALADGIGELRAELSGLRMDNWLARQQMAERLLVFYERLEVLQARVTNPTPKIPRRAQPDHAAPRAWCAPGAAGEELRWAPGDF